MPGTKVGVQVANGNKSEWDIDATIEAIRDGVYLLMQDQLGAAPIIKARYPNAFIVYRHYTSNWLIREPIAYAGEVYKVWTDVNSGEGAGGRRNYEFCNALTWANEQNLADESGGQLGSSPGNMIKPGGYEIINAWNVSFIKEWRRIDRTNAKLVFPAYAAGNSDDQDDGAGIGLLISQPTIELCDYGATHIYWNPDKMYDQWVGLARYDKQAAYFLGKQMIVTESGNFAVTRQDSPIQYRDAASWFQAKDKVVGVCFFIWADPTKRHQMNDMSRNPGIAQQLRDMTRNERPAFMEGTKPVVDVVLTAKSVNAFASPANYGGSFGPCIGVVIHSTGGGASSVENEYSATKNWFQDANAQVSAHRVVGGGRFSEVALSVHDNDQAWHCREENSRRRGIEIAHGDERDNPFWATTPYTDFQYDATAELIVRWNIEDEKRGWKWPLILLTRDQAAAIRPGIVFHRDTPPGIRDGKRDPTPPFDSVKLIDAISRWNTKLRGGTPLPTPSEEAQIKGQAWTTAENLEKLARQAKAAGFFWLGEGIEAAAKDLKVSTRVKPDSEQ